MKNNTTSKKNVRRKVKYPGIVDDAEALGVTYHHLYKVLEGWRPSARLARRYKELKERQRREAEGQAKTLTPGALKERQRFEEEQRRTKARKKEASGMVAA